jgi:hypothetical protein
VTGACPAGYSCLDPGGQNACLPNGTFPGAACRDGTDCDPLPDGGPDQVCVVDVDLCVVDCDLGADAETEDALCAAVSPLLTCSETASDLCVYACVGGACPPGYFCFDAGGENACLPVP